jgi:uncharacterized membrane protein YgcG
MKWISVLALFVGLEVVQAAPARIIIIPEAESANGSSQLSARGQRRAAALASMLSTNQAILRGQEPGALFAGNTLGQQTLEPTSRQTGLQTVFAANQSTPLARMLLLNRGLDGETVVVVWRRAQIPRLLSELGVRRPLVGSRTDRVYVVTFTPTLATVRQFPQALLPGDSRPPGTGNGAGAGGGTSGTGSSSGSGTSGSNGTGGAKG